MNAETKYSGDLFSSQLQALNALLSTLTHHKSSKDMLVLERHLPANSDSSQRTITILTNLVMQVA